MRWSRLSTWIFGGLVALVVLVAGAVWLGGTPLVTWVIEHPLSSAIGRTASAGESASAIGQQHAEIEVRCPNVAEPAEGGGRRHVIGHRPVATGGGDGTKMRRCLNRPFSIQEKSNSM
jgi:hypothetical protein